MNLLEIIEKFQFEVKAGTEMLDREVTGGYVSDLLSDVIAHAEKGYIWITLQIHLNIIVVAAMKELSAIIIVNGRQPDHDTLNKAEQELIPILGTDMNAFQITGKLYQYGVGRKDEFV